MKKFAVIAAMALSMVTMTACGGGDNAADQVSDAQQDKQDAETGSDQQEKEDLADDKNNNNADDDNAEAKDDNSEANNAEDNEEANTENEDDTKSDSDDQSSDASSAEVPETGDNSTDDNDNEEETKLLDAGTTPDFKLNDSGCFSGKFTGSDGCVYKFNKKGRLVITSDEETMAYQYSINGDVISMIAEDGSFGTSRQITLLEDGTYLFDDTMGDQVVLTAE